MNLVYRQYKTSDKEQAWNLHVTILKETGAFFDDKTGKIDSDFDDIEGRYLQKGDFIVAESEGKLVAMGALRENSNGIGEIKRMRVVSEFRGKGVGKTILTMLEQKARDIGYTKLILDTTMNNTIAQHFYESFGYKETGRERYDGNQNVVYYEKPLK